MEGALIGIAGVAAAKATIEVAAKLRDKSPHRRHMRSQEKIHHHLRFVDEDERKLPDEYDSDEANQRTDDLSELVLSFRFNDAGTDSLI